MAAAVENAENHFAVVGVLEEMERTLWAMQSLEGEGDYFDGIWDEFGGEGGFGEIKCVSKVLGHHILSL